MEPPVLQFKDEKGIVHAEYIPPETQSVDFWFSHIRDWLARKMGWESYWWHVDNFLSPEMRKQYDMHFLRHVDDVHDGEPTDRHEHKHYARLKSQYLYEYEWAKRQFAAQQAMDRGDESNEHYGSYEFYGMAYLARWWSAEPSADWTMLYHGVPMLDALQIIGDENIGFKLRPRAEEKPVEEGKPA